MADTRRPNDDSLPPASQEEESYLLSNVDNVTATNPTEEAPRYARLDPEASGSGEDRLPTQTQETELGEVIRLNLPSSRSLSELLEACDFAEAGEKWLECKKEVKVVVTGRSGVGKSTLINRFLGEDKAAVAIGLKPKTEVVSGYACTIKNGTLHLYDSPGLEPGKQWESLKKLKEHFKEQKANPDLVFFCVRMDVAPQQEDYNAMESLSRAFGSQVWANTIIVLTRGNQLAEERFPRCFGDVTEILQHRLTQNNTSFFGRKKGACLTKKVTAVPFIPVGDDISQQFKGREKTWIQELLIESLDRCSTAGAPALLKANWLVYKTHFEATFIGHWIMTKIRKREPYDLTHGAQESEDGGAANVPSP